MERVIDAAATTVSVAALFGAILLAQLAYRGWQASRPQEANPPLHRHNPQASAFQRHRVIWILFDELSYQQTFGQRYPGLTLPGLDALAATSTNFTDAVPLDIYTDIVLPSLFTGQPSDDLRATPAAALSTQ
jgi:hypothetical protein